MKLNFLNRNGEIETLNFLEIKKRSKKPISWELMHNINEHKCRTKEDKTNHDYLQKYIEKVSVFDFNNFTEWGHLQLTPYYQELAIKNGAIDKRTFKEVFK